MFYSTQNDVVLVGNDSIFSVNNLTGGGFLISVRDRSITEVRQIRALGIMVDAKFSTVASRRSVGRLGPVNV